MINTHTKDVCIESILNTNVDHPAIGLIIDFIKDYQGDDEKELGLLCIAVAGLLTNYKEIQIKAEGYDKLKQNQEKYEEELNAIKDDFDNLNAGIFPADPAVSK
jgi:hypothetical protein